MEGVRHDTRGCEGSKGRREENEGKMKKNCKRLRNKKIGVRGTDMKCQEGTMRYMKENEVRGGEKENMRRGCEGKVKGK